MSDINIDGVVAIICMCCLSCGAGAWLVRCQHDKGRCEHTMEREEVEEVLECLRKAGY